MATSQRSRVRKPESVQFWLCVGAVSLGLHSSLLFGLQRWAKVTLVQPDAGPIAVELMDAPDVVGPSVVASPVEPDAIAQVPQTPNAQPDAKLEVKPDVQPEPESETVRKPEPKRESNGPIIPLKKTKKEKPLIESSPKPNKSPIASPTNQSTPTPSFPSQPIGKPGSEDGEGEIRLQVVVKENSAKLSANSQAQFSQGFCSAPVPRGINFPGRYPLQNGEVVVIRITWLIDVASRSLITEQPKPMILSPNLAGEQKKTLEDIAVNIRDQTIPTISGLVTSASQSNRASLIECEMPVTVTR